VNASSSVPARSGNRQTASAKQAATIILVATPAISISVRTTIHNVSSAVGWSLHETLLAGMDN